MSFIEEQKVVIYLDYATIPTLNYILDFVENYQDRETIRLFGLTRFTIPEKVIKAYPEGIIRFFPIVNHNTSEINHDFYNLISESHRMINLEIHLNLFHSLEMILPILNSYIQFKDKFSHLKVHFYDDGSEGVVTLYELSHFEQGRLDKSINLNKSSLLDLVNGKPMTNFEPYIFRYLWSNVLDCEYHLFNTAFLGNDNLSSLANEMKSITRMNLKKYHHFNPNQKMLVLDILNIAHSIEDTFSLLAKDHKICLFIGTTVFDEDERINMSLLERAHINAIKEFTLPEGKFFNGKDRFTFCYKGHPNAKELNKSIMCNFKHLVEIPDFLSLDILFLLGFQPDIVTGFSSTSYFNVNKESIENIIFITKDILEGTENLSYLFNVQKTLSKVLLNLDYISPCQVHYYNEFLN